ncbi:M16 family metallopeptidase [Pleionea sediminis]|uniref:M16 family metallopeptidase n=1 Tax=Pleionea sediminis TaxID=2569479 RepID=UPI00197B739D|nr:pitrilysin family protein [Pleionea sediminis]
MSVKKIVGALFSCLMYVSLAHSLSLEEIDEFTLKNGMKIIVVEDNSIPNANMYLFWRVGSRNEYPGITGISHFFEHMMFNGSKNYGPKMFDRVMEASGGANNAYTTENITAYTNWFPVESMETIFQLEADRIAHLAIEKDVVESERGVVASERRTGLENSNFRAISEEVKNAAFRAHPYSWPVIGHASDIEGWSLEDLVTYHKTYYSPNNAVVVISGDVKVSEVKALAKKYFEPIQNGPKPRNIHTVEPEQKGERRVYLHKPSISSPNIMMAWHIPESKHEDYYSLDILSSILSDGYTSRLYQSLVDEKQLASGVFSYLPKSIDPNLFYVYAVANQDVASDVLEKAMIEVINDVIKKGVSEEELQKIKNNQSVNFYRTIQTINGKSNELGSYEVYFGDYKRLLDAPKYYEKVSLEDIQRVAKKYLVKANRTVGIIDLKEDSHADDL